MTFETAKKIIISAFPDLTPIECVEYESRFVFNMRPKGKAMIPDMIDSLIGITKTDGEIRDFKPFYISDEEYAKGRSINL